MNVLMQPLEEMSGFKEIKTLLEKKNGMIKVTGCLGSQKINLAAGLVPEGYSSLTVCENEIKAHEAFEDWKLYDSDVLLYPARDMVFYKAAVRANPVERDRMKVLRALCEQKKVSIVTSAGGCLDFLLPFAMLKNSVIRLEAGEETDMEELIKKLADIGYERCAEVELPGQFAVRGGIIDIYDLTQEYPYRIEFWGDEIDSVRSFDSQSQRSVEELEHVEIYPATEEPGSDREDFYERLAESFVDYMPGDTVFFLDDPARITENAKALCAEYYNAAEGRIEAGQMSAGEAERMLKPEEMYAKFSKKKTVVLASINSSGEIPLKYIKSIDMTVRSAMSYNNQYELLVKDLKSWKKSKYRTVLLCASRTRGRRLAGDLIEEGLNAFFSEDKDRLLQPSETMVLYGNARKGFEYPLEKFVLITESDMFGQKKKTKRHEKRYDGKSISGFSQLSVGDYVVHEFHGLGIYKGIEKIVRDGTSKDYIKIE